MEPLKKCEKPNPAGSANPLSKLFFLWTRSIFSKGYKKDLEESDLYTILEEDRTDFLGGKLEATWNNELKISEKKKRRPSLQWAVFKTFWKQYVVCFLMSVISFLGIRIIQTILMGKVISYFTPGSDITKHDARIYGGVMIATIFIRLAFDHHYNHLSFKVGMRARVACCSLVYRKLLRFSKASTDNTATGRIVNLMSNDVCRFDYAPQAIGFLIVTPLQTIIITFYLWTMVGPAALVGVAFIFVQTMPVQTYLGKLIAKLRKKIAVRTDERMRLMTEIVSGIQVIKMYAWEKPFAKLVEIARLNEISKVTYSSYLRGFYLASIVYLERSTLFATLLTYVLLGYDITPEKVFTLAQFYNNLNQTMAIYFPAAVEYKAESSVSIRRLEDLLLEEEAECTTTNNNNKSETSNEINNAKPNGISDSGVAVVNASAKWRADLVRDSLSNITFRVPEGKLCAVIGPVGSGKSSLLQALVRELPVYSGSVSISGTISYASQEPWLFVGTVRQNILFGQPFIAEKYKEVIRVCALQKDFEMFRHGDRTLVGEKGISLSGGQRARINLARAVYRNTDVYLFDDPLSAVDTHVGKHLFQECIQTYLRNKTRILVTHQLQYIKDADLVIILNNGEIENQGTFAQMQSSGLNFAKLLAKEENDNDKEEPAQVLITKRLISDMSSTDENESHRRSVRRRSTRRRPSTRGDSVSGSFRKDGSLRNSFTSDDYQATLKRTMIKRHMRQPSLMSTASNKKRGPNNKSEGASKPPTGANILWRGTRRMRGALKNILRNRSFLQCCPIAIYRDRPRTNSQETVSNISERQSSDDSWFGDDMDECDEENQESRNIGTISYRTYWQYFSAGGSVCFFLATAFMLILAQVITSGADYWVTFWTNEEVVRQAHLDSLKERLAANESHRPLPPLVEDYTKVNKRDSLIIYGCLIIAAMFITLIRSIMFIKTCMKASTRLHNAMFSSILRGAMRFFDTNPSGRILNRFSKDIGAIDELLPRFMLESIQVFLVLIGILTNIAIVNTYFILPMVVLGFCYYGVTIVYLRTSRNVKRLEGTTRSPVYSHLSDTLTGLTTIRVSGAQEMVRCGFDSRQDDHTGAWSLFLATSNAFGFWMDILSSLFVASITLTFFILEENIGAKVGLALSQALIVTGMLQYGLLRATEVVSQMTSVERVLDYTNIEKEADLESAPDKKPAPTWPSQGGVEFDHLYLKYGEDQPCVLKDLHFKIAPSHKVGIVGRTGAGKSSLISALFRLAKLDGSIKIDGINTNDIGLHDLRARISIIPQEPVLFSESLRHNLDPFDQFSDEALWNSLEEVDLKAAVTSLDMQVQEGGSNFSVGQRQLICLARAILRNNKILVLDEATANVDPETDTFVQETIRRKFKNCTVLTIAHRLNTIMDSDRVLVMDSGTMVEYDHPYALLQRNNGYFFKLVEETGPTMADQLLRVAEEAYKKTYQIDGIPDYTAQHLRTPRRETLNLNHYENVHRSCKVC
ncbi:multidrug resistance-associated protein 4-like isoform X2 [Zootermopsis nevadensis]|uniref:multidrug resistance-associated protein 4-like isoform X2 n=1 Tax=Zootermopsis nevadensis TaxID=136037 RepID=UPI000B8E69F1|nr:multidrug resistance-associated protein 4-like isoform X2 [Zootermopsis nevadensis]